MSALMVHNHERRIGFSSRLRSLIIARGVALVPSQLAADFGAGQLVTAQTFSNWLNGVQMPRKGAVLQLAEWLHTTEDFLLNGVAVLQFKGQPAGQVSDEDARLLHQIAQLDPYGRRVVTALLNSLVNLKATTA